MPQQSKESQFLKPSTKSVIPAYLLDRIDWVGLPKSQYYQEVYPKRQLVYHHTASGRGADGDINWWLSDPLRIATFAVINYDGRIKQLFNSRYWAHHLGMKDGFNLARNQESIGIEIDSWGPLAYINGKFFSYTGTEVPESRVTRYSIAFKTYPKSAFFDKVSVTGEKCYFFESYTPAQIETVRHLTLYLGKLYGIPLEYNPTMWDVSSEAIEGKHGIWTHVSYRTDKLDCHPQPELIEMIKKLSHYGNTD